jgi:F-type H+-transporting ATPase subunit delta
MASGKKQLQQLARQLFKLSFANGELSAERVAGVLAYVEKTKPVHTAALLKAYQRLIAGEVARRQAVVEHAGAIDRATLDSIAAAMARLWTLRHRRGQTEQRAARRSARAGGGRHLRILRRRSAFRPCGLPLKNTSPISNYLFR